MQKEKKLTEEDFNYYMSGCEGLKFTGDDADNVDNDAIDAIPKLAQSDVIAGEKKKERSYFKKFSQKIGSGKSVFKVTLQDNTKTITEVTVTGKKNAPTTGLEIPQREYAGAVQNFKYDTHGTGSNKRLDNNSIRIISYMGDIKLY